MFSIISISNPNGIKILHGVKHTVVDGESSTNRLSSLLSRLSPRSFGVRSSSVSQTSFLQTTDVEPRMSGQRGLAIVRPKGKSKTRKGRKRKKKPRLEQSSHYSRPPADGISHKIVDYYCGSRDCQAESFQAELNVAGKDLLIGEFYDGVVERKSSTNRRVLWSDSYWFRFPYSKDDTLVA